MPSGEIDVTPGYTFTEDEAVTLAKLNQLATPTLRIAEGSITARELAPEAFRAENFPDGEITLAKLDTTGATEGDVIRVRSGVCVFEALTEAMLVGGGILWFTEDEPEGWFIPRGNNLVRADNPLLFTRWGTLYGEGDGVTTFGTPDLRLRFPRMTDLSTVTVGDTGGADTHTLSLDELPAHSHPAAGQVRGNDDNTPGAKIQSSGTTNGTVDIPSGTAGGGLPHNNLPAYFVVCILVKLG